MNRFLLHCFDLKGIQLVIEHLAQVLKENKLKKVIDKLDDLTELNVKSSVLLTITMLS